MPLEGDKKKKKVVGLEGLSDPTCLFWFCAASVSSVKLRGKTAV